MRPLLAIIILGLALLVWGDCRADDPLDALAPLTAALESRQPRAAGLGGDTSYSAWTADGYRWGWINTQPTGEWFGWDNNRGYHWGRIEVQRDR